MKIVSERVGQSVLVTIEDCCREVALVLTLPQATRLGTTLLAQASIDDDGLELPEAFRPKESDS